MLDIHRHCKPHENLIHSHELDMIVMTNQCSKINRPKNITNTAYPRLHSAAFMPFSVKVYLLFPLNFVKVLIYSTSANSTQSHTIFSYYIYYLSNVGKHRTERENPRDCSRDIQNDQTRQDHVKVQIKNAFSVFICFNCQAYFFVFKIR